MAILSRLQCVKSNIKVVMELYPNSSIMKSYISEKQHGDPVYYQSQLFVPVIKQIL